MITVLVGENFYEKSKVLKDIIDDKQVEIFDGESLTVADLPSLIFGNTLFSPNRTIVIKNFSKNKPVWDAFGVMVGENSSNDIVLIEEDIDKRTKTYKLLQKIAKVQQFDCWSERQIWQAQKWLREYVSASGVVISTSLQNEMIQRAIRSSSNTSTVIIDQTRLANAVDQLSIYDEEITQEIMDAVLPPSVHENVFNLLKLSLDSKTESVTEVIDNLKKDQDPHMLMGLLISQFNGLAVCILAGDKNVGEISQDTGLHTFVLNQFRSYAERIGVEDLKQITYLFAEADLQIKTGQDPWQVLQLLLQQLSLSQKHD